MSSPPKRDKFAALAARQTETTTSSPDNTGTSTKHTTSNTTTSTTNNNTNTNSPPKRDKLSAMAARQHSNSGSSPPDHASTTATDAGSTLTATATTIAPPRRRDKFASAHSTLQETAEKHRKQQHEESHRKELAQKCQQRDAVWRDLERAEALTVRLLDLAHEAASYWSHPEDQNQKQPLSVEPFQTTLQEIHTALHPHAALVQAYQAPQKTNRMYQSRVEWRLAESRKEILKEYLELEKTASTCSTNSNSNKRLKESEQDQLDPPTKQAKTQDTS